MNKKTGLYSVVTKINFICGSNLMTCVEGFERKNSHAKPLSSITEDTIIIITWLSRAVKCFRGHKTQKPLT